MREELGLDLTAGPLRVLAWTPARRPGRHARSPFIFDMGTRDAHTLTPLIRLQAAELDTWQWTAPDEALRLLHPDVAARLAAAQSGPATAVYGEQR